MRKLSFLLALIAILCVSTSSFAQFGVCTSSIIKYNGPKTTNELRNRLQNSSSPLVQQISAQAKAALIANVVFEQNRPVSFKHIDANIQALVDAPNADAIFTAIFNIEVHFYTYSQMPSVVTMTYQELVTRLLGSGGTVSTDLIAGGMSICKNCLRSESGSRCCVPVNEKADCMDIVVKFTGDDILYKIVN